jgi:hypothetical protein
MSVTTVLIRTPAPAQLSLAKPTSGSNRYRDCILHNYPSDGGGCVWQIAVCGPADSAAQ